MYSKMMVPVDLEHIEGLDKALATAAEIAKLYNCSVCYVGVAASAPSSVAHTPNEFAQKMKEFGEQEGAKRGLSSVSSAAYISHDPAVDLDDTLMEAAKDCEADLVVMGSHIPNVANHIFASNAGYFASYAKMSVFVVR